eukprot:TRINITY_DN22199_c0_g1_i1.p1 TRINITY_DN22199_c0_g1~~TRINITY_DN22199_c0_g1_i1.p1  ORF type:complete len:614 (+),score=75.08 TRINITY_DN22199_c0_g1_i1:55-1842(+)
MALRSPGGSQGYLGRSSHCAGRGSMQRRSGALFFEDSSFGDLLTEIERVHEQELESLRTQYEVRLQQQQSCMVRNSSNDAVLPEDSCSAPGDARDGMINCDLDGSKDDLGDAASRKESFDYFSIIERSRLSFGPPSGNSRNTSTRNSLLNRIDLNDSSSPEHYYSLAAIVHGKYFEPFFCGLVFVNALFSAFETQYVGHDIGHQLGQVGHERDAVHQYPHALLVFQLASWIFGLAFVLELILRVACEPRSWFRNPWVWLDFVVVIGWALSKAEEALVMNSTVLRLARLFRLLRLLKLARAIRGFDSLYIITTAVKGCVYVLFWAFITFGLVQLMLSLFLTQYLHTFFFTGTVDSAAEKEVFSYYGTFIRCFFTFFEITLGNWPPACRVLAEHVGEVFFMLGLLHKLIIGFAIVAVINGVFIQETFRVTAADDVLMVKRKQQQTKSLTSKMRKLLHAADESGDGMISLSEWEQLLEGPGVKSWLSSMEFDARDAKAVFELLDESRDGLLSLEELVEGVSKLKGPARSLDFHAALRQGELRRTNRARMFGASHALQPAASPNLPVDCIEDAVEEEEEDADETKTTRSTDNAGKMTYL